MISTFRDAMINYYVRDVEGLAAFYCNNFGFKETFRTPEKGPAVHIEVRLGDFALGLADVEAARSMHSLSLKPGPPRGEVAMWTDDVDEVYKTLTQKGIRCISTPHDFLGTPPLRAAWFEDPEGNIFQIVCKRKQAGQL